MTVPNAAFKVGDSVVYPTQGAGRIVGQVERIIAGKTNYYFESTLFIFLLYLTIWIIESPIINAFTASFK